MMSRFKLSVLLTLVVAASAFAGQEGAAGASEKKVSLGKIAQTTQSTRIYSRPSTRSKVRYTAAPEENLVVQDYKPGSPWKMVVLANMTYGYVRSETINVSTYDYLVNESSFRRQSAARQDQVAMANSPRATALSSRSAAGLRAAVAQYSLNFKGTPYVWGGNDLKNGVDCSGFVKQLYGQIGLNLPRTAAQQVNVGKKITRLEDLQPGDRLYFWDYGRNCVGHTGIYYGGGYFVHSSRTHRGVDKDYLGEPRWMRILVAARR